MLHRLLGSTLFPYTTLFRSPKLVDLLGDLFPESESALRNGLAGSGDLRILEYACAGGFVLVSTDSDFDRLSSRFTGANRSEEHTSELQSRGHLVCRLLLEKK